MSKPIIAFSFSGVIMNSAPWKKAHEIWFESYSKKLRMPEVALYAKKPDWFNYVDKVMALAEPKMNDKQRTDKAREVYFKAICDFGCDDPSLENKDIVKYLYSLKKNFSLGLITTTPLETINKILSALNHNDLFDFVECSLLSEKDDKIAVFNRFIKAHGAPALFVGDARKEVISFCADNKIKFVFANFENEKDQVGVLVVHDVAELKEIISSLKLRN